MKADLRFHGSKNQQQKRMANPGKIRKLYSHMHLKWKNVRLDWFLQLWCFTKKHNLGSNTTQAMRVHQKITDQGVTNHYVPGKTNWCYHTLIKSHLHSQNCTNFKMIYKSRTKIFWWANSHDGICTRFGKSEKSASHLQILNSFLKIQSKKHFWFQILFLLSNAQFTRLTTGPINNVAIALL